MSTRPRITEADAERMADWMVFRRLAIDGAYRNATSAEDQSAREDEITDAVLEEINAKYEIV